MQIKLTFIILLLSIKGYTQYNSSFTKSDFHLKGSVVSLLTASYSAEEKFGEPHFISIVKWGFSNENSLRARNHLVQFNNKGYIELIKTQPKFDTIDLSKPIDSYLDSFYEDNRYVYNRDKLVKIINSKNYEVGIRDPVTGKQLNSERFRTFRYDENSRINREDVINEIGKLEYSTRIKTLEGKEHDMTYNSDGKLLWGTITKKGSKIDTIQKINQDKEVTSISVITYNNNNQEINEKSFNKQGVLLREWKSTFNSKGFIKSKDFLNYEDSQQRKTTFTYEYDQVGNWIQKNIYVNNKLTISLIRKIIYFKN